MNAKANAGDVIVIYRRWRDGSIIALFPELREDNGLCSSYMHIGQHSSADYGLVIERTRSATAVESAALHAELLSIGYTLRVRRRSPAWSHLRKVKP